MRTVALATLFSLAAGGAAVAQPTEPAEAPVAPVEAPPAPLTPPPPPSAYAYPPGLQLTPAPSPWREHLRDRGHRHVAAGGALIAVGTLGLVGGVVMAALAVDCTSAGHYYDYYGGTYHARTDCVATNDGLLAGGVVTGLVGTGLLLSGIVTHVVGRAELARARRVSWSVAPHLGTTTQGASLALRF